MSNVWLDVLATSTEDCMFNPTAYSSSFQRSMLTIYPDCSQKRDGDEGSAKADVNLLLISKNLLLPTLSALLFPTLTSLFA